MKKELGDILKERVTGIKGTAVARTVHLAGCDRITIQPKPKKGDTTIPDALTFDEPLLDIVSKAKNGVKKDKSNTNGGPMTRGLGVKYGKQSI